MTERLHAEALEALAEMRENASKARERETLLRAGLSEAVEALGWLRAFVDTEFPDAGGKRPSHAMLKSSVALTKAVALLGKEK